MRLIFLNQSKFLTEQIYGLHELEKLASDANVTKAERNALLGWIDEIISNTKEGRSATPSLRILLIYCHSYSTLFKLGQKVSELLTYIS
jgi:hypothetical protein